MAPTPMPLLPADRMASLGGPLRVTRMLRDELRRRLLAAMRVLVSFVLANMFVVAATAAPLSPVARAEIDSLMSRLEATGCEFSRNGKWYAGAEAKSHLLRKLQYLEERGAVQSTEQFIELAASSSSASGQPYLVKCNNGVPIPSGVWLRTQLQTLRKSAPAKGAP